MVVSSKATPEEIKEKMEQQLRIQRAAHHQKRALEMQKQGKYNCKELNSMFKNSQYFASFHVQGGSEGHR